MKALQDLRQVADQPCSRFESLQAAREVEASTGWDRLRELGGRLLDRARETYAAVLAFREELRPAVVERRRQGRDEEPEYVYSGPRM